MTNTRFFKTLTCILICATFALCYVHQEISIVKTGLLINKHRGELSFMLDHYRSLVYNLSQLESPKRIEDMLCVNEITLCMPEAENIRQFGEIGFAYAGENEKAASEPSFLARIFDRFSAKAEAEVVE